MNRRLGLLFALLIILSLTLAACGGGDDEKPADTQPEAQPTEPAVAAGDAAKGKETYAKACAACHGANAEGVEGLGKSWNDNEWIQGSSDDELLTFIKEGRPADDPDNTTGVAMPPKGGNPGLTDEEILDIIAFMRSLQ
jgi:disulfide bond formation protein DsbB